MQTRPKKEEVVAVKKKTQPDARKSKPEPGACHHAYCLYFDVLPLVVLVVLVILVLMVSLMWAWCWCWC